MRVTYLLTYLDWFVCYTILRIYLVYLSSCWVPQWLLWFRCLVKANIQNPLHQFPRSKSATSL